MGIEALFGRNRTVSGSVNKKRREVLTKMLQSMPAEIKDGAGKSVPMTVEFVKINVYSVEVSIPGYNNGESKIHIGDANRVTLVSDRESMSRTRLVYAEPATNPGACSGRTRRYNLWIR